MGTARREDDVVLTPYDKHRRLMLAKIGVPLGIEPRIGSIIIEQGQHEVFVAGAAEQCILKDPAIWADLRDVLNPVGIIPFKRLSRDASFANGFEILRRWILPQLANGRPEAVRQTFLISVCILNNQEGDAVRMLAGKAESHRTAEVLHVERIPLDAELLDELLHDLRQPIEGIGKFGSRWRIAVSETGVVRSDDTEAGGEPLEQVAKHERGCRKSVKQKKDGVLLIASFSIENLEAIYFGGAITGH